MTGCLVHATHTYGRGFFCWNKQMPASMICDVTGHIPAMYTSEITFQKILSDFGDGPQLERDWILGFGEGSKLWKVETAKSLEAGIKHKCALESYLGSIEHEVTSPQVKSTFISLCNSSTILPCGGRTATSVHNTSVSLWTLLRLPWGLSLKTMFSVQPKASI